MYFLVNEQMYNILQGIYNDLEKEFIRKIRKHESKSN